MAFKVTEVGADNVIVFAPSELLLIAERLEQNSKQSTATNSSLIVVYDRVLDSSRSEVLSTFSNFSKPCLYGRI